MDVFLRMSYYVCLLLGIVLAVINRKELKSRQLIFFIPYLCLVLAQELVLDFIYTVGPTGMVYNIYRLVTTCFFTLFFYRIPFITSVRRIILLLLGLYLIVCLVTFALIQPITQYNSYLSLAGGLVIVSCGIFFLFNYFNLDKPAEEKNWLPVIWITIGLILYYPVVNVSFALNKYILTYDATIFGILLYNAIPQLMSTLMYSCFAYAFYLCKRKN